MIILPSMSHDTLHAIPVADGNVEEETKTFVGGDGECFIFCGYGFRIGVAYDVRPQFSFFLLLFMVLCLAVAAFLSGGGGGDGGGC